MKRSPLRRGNSLKSRKGLARSGKIKRVNPKRLKRRRDIQFGPKAKWIRTLDCATCGAPGPSDPSHATKSRGAGGTADHLIPQCRTCHTLLHAIGRTLFEVRRRCDLEEEVELYEKDWQDRLQRLVDVVP